MPADIIYPLVHGGGFGDEWPSPDSNPYNESTSTGSSSGPGTLAQASRNERIGMFLSTSESSEYEFHTLDEVNVHALIERVVGDDSETIRFRDTIGFDTDGAENVVGLFGFFSTAYAGLGPYYMGGIGFLFDLEADTIYTYIADKNVGGRELADVRRKYDTGVSPNEGTGGNHVEVLIRGDKRTVYFLINGLVVDWYRPAQGTSVRACGACPRPGYYIYAENADMGSSATAYMHFRGSSEPWMLSLGEYSPAEAAAVTATPSPQKPTITVTNVLQTRANGNSSPFVSSTEVVQTHPASQWQVTLTADGSFSNTTIDSGAVSGAQLLQILFSGLTPETDYRARLRHLGQGPDGSVAWSEWSDSVEFTTLAEGDGPEGGSGLDCQGNDEFGVTVWSQD